MNYLQKVQQGIDFIENNIDESFSLRDVALAAGISHWHFQRIFRALSNETLKTYIRSRRMARALDRLLTTRLRILDIAIYAGFESQESFSRAFKTTFNMTPNVYRKLGDTSLFLRKLRIDSDYLDHIGHRVSSEPKLHQQDTMQLVGLKTLFFGVDSEKNNIADKLPPLWESFLPLFEDIPNRIAGNAYGVIQQVKGQTDQLEYYAAVEVSKLAELTGNLASIKIPTTQYAQFCHAGATEELDNTVNYVYSNWLLGSQYRHT